MDNVEVAELLVLIRDVRNLLREQTALLQRTVSLLETTQPRNVVRLVGQQSTIEIGRRA